MVGRLAARVPGACRVPQREREAVRRAGARALPAAGAMHVPRCRDVGRFAALSEGGEGRRISGSPARFDRTRMCRLSADSIESISCVGPSFPGRNKRSLSDSSAQRPLIPERRFTAETRKRGGKRGRKQDRKRQRKNQRGFNDRA